MMQDALVSSEPHPSIPPDQRIFAPLIGAWDLQVTWYADGDVLRRAAGEWTFGWVLEGRGIQDVWIVPPRGQRDDSANLYEYGTSLRFYAPEVRAWRSTWVGPMHDMVRTFLARQIDDTIVLETDGGSDDALRWVFSDMSENAFVWRNFIRRDDAWHLQQDFRCTRRR